MSTGTPMEAPFLVGNRTVGRLAAGTNEAAAGAVSHFAKRQLQKFGWKEGDGLGKERQGNVKHVAVSRKDDSQGIGFSQNGDWTDQWWWGKGYGSVKVKVRRDSATSADDSSDDSDSDSEGEGARGGREAAAVAASGGAPTDDELLRMCGGRRLGMRARGSQQGKWKRAEAAVAEAAAEALAASADAADDEDARRAALTLAASGGRRKRAREDSDEVDTAKPVKRGAEGPREPLRLRLAGVVTSAELVKQMGAAAALAGRVST